MKSIILTVIAIVACTLYLSAKPENEVPYPTGFRQWAHVKSAMIGPESPAFEVFGGLYHIYANEKAMEGYRTGKFPDGAVLVFDLLESKENAGLMAEGPRRRTGVMVKDSKRYVETGGWGFESFQGDSQTERRVATQAATKCFACHEQKKGNDYVFSSYRK